MTRGPIDSTAEALPVVADELPVGQLRRLMVKAISLPLAMMLLLCALLGWQVAVLVEEDGHVARAQQVIGETNLAQKLLLDHETALRGYMLTGEDMFLAPLRFGQANLPDALRRLRVHLAGDPEQQARLDALADRYRAWLALLDVEAVASPAPRDPALVRLLTERKAQMDAMRGLVDALLAAEERRLARAEAQAAWSTRLAVFGGAALLLALGVVTGAALRRWFRRMEGTYAKALVRRRESEGRERSARQAAEALAAEVTAQSRELEARIRAMRRELELARGAPHAG